MPAKLPRKVKAIDLVEEKYRDLYEPKGEEFLLTLVEDHDAPDILRSVRGEAAGLRIKNKQLTDQMEVFTGLEPEAVKLALTENVALKAEIAAFGTKDKEKFNEAVQARVRTELAPVQSKLDAALKDKDKLQKENETFQKQTKSRLIHDEAIAACVKQNVQKTAYTGKHPDALLWAQEVAVITDDGKIIEKDTGLPLADALRAMQDSGERAHWFGTSFGGDAAGSKGSGGKPNPWLAEYWNPTEQSAIQEKEPERANAMARVAGVDVDAAYHPKNGIPVFSQY